MEGRDVDRGGELTLHPRSRIANQVGRNVGHYAVERAEEVRDLELQRLDEMTAGLWPQIQAGSPPAVTAAIRVSERRARLLGLDEPVATRTELTGSLGVYAERLAGERELFSTLTIEQMEELAAESEALVAKARRMAAANAASGAPSTSPRAVLEGETIDVPPADPT